MNMILVIVSKALQNLFMMLNTSWGMAVKGCLFHSRYKHYGYIADAVLKL